MASVYDFTVKNIRGKDVKLESYKGKALLIVNTASECGFTPQYKGLEALYEKLHGKGLEILGFPCNQFGAQEPGSEKDIESFCEVNYGVTFPMFAKVDVNGDNAAPLYRFLKKEKPGLLVPRQSSGTSPSFSSIATAMLSSATRPTPSPRSLSPTSPSCSDRGWDEVRSSRRIRRRSPSRLDLRDSAGPRAARSQQSATCRISGGGDGLRPAGRRRRILEQRQPGDLRHAVQVRLPRAPVQDGAEHRRPAMPEISADGKTWKIRIRPASISPTIRCSRASGAS
jgi:glutathione peroxidase